MTPCSNPDQRLAPCTPMRSCLHFPIRPATNALLDTLEPLKRPQLLWPRTYFKHHRTSPSTEACLYRSQYFSSLDFQQLKAFRAVSRCRTAALGGHLDVCLSCGHQAGISYNSCRNRSCPKCQAQARERSIGGQQQELLDTNYFHVVFTIPELNPLALNNPARFYLLFTATAHTLLEVAADPKHLGAEIGFLSILHTWGQNLLAHPHIHCVIPAGGLSPDHERWIHTRYRFLLPLRVLRRVFRGKFMAGLRRLHRSGLLDCSGPAAAFHHPNQFFHPAVAAPFPSPLGRLCQAGFWQTAQVLHSFGDPHRIAISNPVCSPSMGNASRSVTRTMPTAASSAS